jgi:hypothetical protein
VRHEGWVRRLKEAVAMEAPDALPADQEGLHR